MHVTGFISDDIQQRFLFFSVKDAETSIAEFMETKPIISEIDARLNYYMVN